MAGGLYQSFGRGLSQKRCLHVTADPLVQIRLENAGISVVHDLLEYGLNGNR